MRVGGQGRRGRPWLGAGAGGGRAQGEGSIGLGADSGFPGDITAKLDNAQLAKSDALSATTSGTIHLTNGKGGTLIPYPTVAWPAS